MQMQEVFNFHTITNNTPSTTGSISSTSNQCAWWAVRASWPGMVWFLMSVRSSLLLLLPFSLPPPVSQNPRTSSPLLPPVMVTDPSGTAYPCILEQLFGSSASVALRAKDERGSGKTSFFPCFSPSVQHNTKLISPPVFLFFHSPNNQHLSASAPLTLTGNFDSCWLNSLCLQRVQNQEVEEIYRKASRLLSLYNYSDVKS